MQVLIPAAGLGTRFSTAGFTVPKPFIMIEGVPMVFRVMNMVMPLPCTALIRPEHAEYIPPHRIDNVMVIEPQSEGAAMTVLCAQAFMREEEDVLIINSDNLFSRKAVDSFVTHAHELSHEGMADGLILTGRVNGPSWSYVKCAGTSDIVTMVAEKKQISDLGTLGMYWFRSWKALRYCIMRMIVAQDRTNNEFYLAPTYNYMRGAVHAHTIPMTEFFPLGTPEQFETTMKNTYFLQMCREYS